MKIVLNRSAMTVVNYHLSNMHKRPASESVFPLMVGSLLKEKKVGLQPLEDKEEVKNWIRNGISVKKTALKHLRLMLYDSKVCYFMSYKHSESGQDQGMKIVFPPFAAILSQYFGELWEKGEKID